MKFTQSNFKCVSVSLSVSCTLGLVHNRRYEAPHGRVACGTNGIRISTDTNGTPCASRHGVRPQGPKVKRSSIYITACAKRHDEGSTSAKAGLNRTDDWPMALLIRNHQIAEDLPATVSLVLPHRQIFVHQALAAVECRLLPAPLVDKVTLLSLSPRLYRSRARPSKTRKLSSHVSLDLKPSPETLSCGTAVNSI